MGRDGRGENWAEQLWLHLTAPGNEQWLSTQPTWGWSGRSTEMGRCPALGAPAVVSLGCDAGAWPCGRVRGEQCELRRESLLGGNGGFGVP